MPDPSTLHGQSVSAAIERFVRDSAERGCRIHHRGGGTCIDQQESATAARDSGVQPATGPVWGTEGETGAFRDKVADGHGMCIGCRARRALEGAYIAPGSKGHHA